MTLDKLLKRIDQQKPNAYTRQEKIEWVNQLDGMVQTKVIDTHADADRFWMAYTDDDGDTELLVPEPFDQIYMHWLEAKIDYANAEYGKYNNSMAMYNAVWSEYCRWYNRTHEPKSQAFVYF